MQSTSSPVDLMVSVVIPAYNQAQYLATAVESVLSQSHRTYEIIIVDDGSPDETSEVAAGFGDRVRYIRKQNAGLSAARNTGILHARGDFLVFLDSDDALPVDALERHIGTAVQHPEADVFYAEAFHYIDSSGLPLDRTFRPGFAESGSLLHELLRGNVFPPHAVMTRKCALAKGGLFDTQLTSYEDWDMWLRLAAAGTQFVRTKGLDVPYRQHAESMSSNAARMFLNGLTVLDNHAKHHGRCVECRRISVHARWRLRRRYAGIVFDNLWSNTSRLNTRLVTLQEAWGVTVRDPLLLAAGLRYRLQQAKHGLLNVTRRYPDGVGH